MRARYVSTVKLEDPLWKPLQYGSVFLFFIICKIKMKCTNAYSQKFLVFGDLVDKKNSSRCRHFILRKSVLQVKQIRSIFFIGSILSIVLVPLTASITAGFLLHLHATFIFQCSL